jgi:tellurite resistance protein TerC
MWAGFFGFVLAMLALDLFALGGRHAHRVSMREAAGWTVAWIALSLCFCALLWFHLDASAGRAIANDRALEFLTGYIVEKSLAVDNIFVWLMIFGYFTVPPELQRRVLLYGILGALVLRTGMILGGAWLIAHFSWVLYGFGAFLVVSGIRMAWSSEHQPDLERNPLLRWMRRHMEIAPRLEGERFFVLRDGRWIATPLLVVVVLVEVSDVIFAVDSIPAIFAITTDPFIVLTSNIFAVLGLRAMYFLLAGAADRFTLLKYGLAVVLVFIGSKMLIEDFIHIPVLVSLGVVVAVIGLSMALSLLLPRPAPDPDKA